MTIAPAAQGEAGDDDTSRDLADRLFDVAGFEGPQRPDEAGLSVLPGGLGCWHPVAPGLHVHTPRT